MIEFFYSNHNPCCVRDQRLMMLFCYRFFFYRSCFVTGAVLLQVLFCYISTLWHCAVRGGRGEESYGDADDSETGNIQGAHG